jgi:hypothetical protein
MKNVFCVRPKGFNVGNEVIGFALSRLLRDAFGDLTNLIPVPATEDERDGWHAGLAARTVHEMNLYGQGVVVGGGNLYENGRLIVDPGAVACLRPPLLLCSLSYGRIYDHRRSLTRRTDAMPDELVRSLNEHAILSLARDDATVAHLHALGLPEAQLAGCPTMLVRDMVAPLEAGGSPAGTMLAVRGPQLMSVPLADMARVGTDIRRLVDALEAEGRGPVRLLCNDRRDLGFGLSLGDVECILPDDLESYLRLLRGTPLLVSFRLHASVPALSFGVPVVNISYDERSLSLMRTLGLEDWDVDFVMEPDVVAAVLDRVRRLDDLSALRERAQPTWDRLEHTLRSALAEFAAAVTEYAAD